MTAPLNGGESSDIRASLYLLPPTLTFVETVTLVETVTFVVEPTTDQTQRGYSSSENRKG